MRPGRLGDDRRHGTGKRPAITGRAAWLPRGRSRPPIPILLTADPGDEIQHFSFVTSFFAMPSF